MNYIGLIMAFITLILSTFGYAGKIPKKCQNVSFLIAILCAIVLICMYGYKTQMK